MDLMELFSSLRGMVGSKKEEELLKKLFFRFEEIYPNFGKVYDQKMNFLNPAISNESKNALTLEMTNLLRPKIEEKIAESAEKSRILLYIIENAEAIFEEVLLAPNDTEVKELKDHCSNCNKNWNWMYHYTKVGISYFKRKFLHKLKFL